MCGFWERGVEDGCVVVCVHVWVCVEGTRGAGVKKYESVSDLIGLRGWSWMLELDAGAGCWSFLRQFKVASCSRKSC